VKIRLFLAVMIAAALLSAPLALRAEQKSDSPKTAFYNGNALYEKGDYKAAIAEYEKILGTGYESGELYYNLGNSYFKDGQLGKAILNYRRAGRIIPRGRDLGSNCKHVLSLTKGAAPAEPKILPFRLMDAAGRYFTVNELTLFLSVLFFLFMGIVLVHVYFRRVRAYFGLIIACLSVLFVTGAALTVNEVEKIGKEAIIISKEANSKFEPFKRATTHFTLHEGEAVTVLDSKDAWRKIKRPDGKTGWVNKGNLEII